MRDPVPAADADLGLPRWRRRLRSRRFVVRDASMSPALLPGDRLWVDVRALRHRLPRIDEIVVVRDPEEPRRLLVKRVAAIGPGAGGSARDAPVPAGQVLLRGDNAATSRDSRRFGPVPLGGLVGSVWFRYAPADRRGTLPAPR